MFLIMFSTRLMLNMILFFVTSYRRGTDGLPEYAYDYSSVP